MRVIIAGSRTITDYSHVQRAMRDVLERGGVVDEVVSGGARGVDQMGLRWAREHDVPTKVFIPAWDRLGKRAGIARNEDMARYADMLVAIYDGKSRGTADMIARATAHGRVVVAYLVTGED